MFAPPAHQPACMLLPSTLAKACCTCLMLLYPSVLFLPRSLSPSLWCVLGRCCCCVCCVNTDCSFSLLDRHLWTLLFCLLPPVWITLSCTVGRWSRCSFPSWSSVVPACDESSYSQPSQALFSSLSFFFLTLWEFPLPLRYPEVFRGLVLADWSIYAPCVSSFSPLWLVKV